MINGLFRRGRSLKSGCFEVRPLFDVRYVEDVGDMQVICCTTWWPI